MAYAHVLSYLFHVPPILGYRSRLRAGTADQHDLIERRSKKPPKIGGLHDNTHNFLIHSQLRLVFRCARLAVLCAIAA